MQELSELEGKDRPFANGSATVSADAAPRRVAIVVSGPRKLAAARVAAIEREMPWLLVSQVGRVEQACVAYPYPVALILVDPAFLKEAESLGGELTRRHPAALAAVMDYGGSPACSLSQLLGSKLIRGALPMDMELEIWLSVIRLMLRGGEYFPPRMFHDHARPGNGSGAGYDHGATPRPGGEMVELTGREAEILELVSRGLQNKAIAADLRLSEHTVKIHIHNIIRKLGAHNRTEAAARFHDRRGEKNP
ncbi:response regulator transcription factor [Aquamicrobium sp. LC103]|uniref:response regulator transcription factor n=1 Tax=Aquamicrobium sp. LC103 TaxID=1120658 RepID=UPI0009E5CD9F|nr:response regulator transcription factor [Aquamicrobium sp. LC103]TKT80251.1 response regulator transcription factor [Aquamicrobium sp. LC103]